MPGKYDDIIDLPWPQPQPRDPMPISERAAQFSPFAALTGFEELIAETEELTAASDPPLQNGQ